MSIDTATREEWDRAAYNARLAEDNAKAELTPRDIEALNLALDAPFGELPLATRAYVFLLYQTGKVHIFHRHGGVVEPQWLAAVRYRVVAVEKPKTKPSIDWSHVAPQYKWLARDIDDAAYVYVNKPFISAADMWEAPAYDHYRANGFASYVAGDCDWKESLVERPAGA